MTRILFDIDRLTVTMEGHAGAGEAGHDLVCAGLSALLRVLLLEVEKHGGAYDVDDEAGKAKVELNLWSCNLLRGVCEAFKWMAKEYPGYVSYMEITSHKEFLED